MAEDAQSGDAAGQPSSDDRGGSQCPMCNADLFKRHCKYVCPQHGVLYDCSDSFWLS